MKDFSTLFIITGVKTRTGQKLRVLLILTQYPVGFGYVG